MQNHFQGWHKVTNIAWNDIPSMSLLQYLARFNLQLCTWRVTSSRPEEIYEKGVHKYSTEFTRKHLRWVLFCNKSAGWRPATLLNTGSFTGAFLWIFWNLYKNIYFTNVCEGMPLKRKIFTGVSFLKILGFYYKWKRHLFYYEGTS